MALDSGSAPGAVPVTATSLPDLVAAGLIKAEDAAVPDG